MHPLFTVPLGRGDALWVGGALVVKAPPRVFAPGDGSCGSLAIVLGGERSHPSFLGGEQTLQLFPGARSLS